MGTPEDIRHYQALGAVDQAIDLTVGVEEWSIPANSFTDFPPVPNLTKSNVILPILLKAERGKMEVRKAAEKIAEVVPHDLAMALGTRRLENLMGRYIRLIYEKNSMARIGEVENFKMDGRRGTGGHGIFATQDIGSKTVIEVHPSHYQSIVFKSWDNLSF